MSQPATSVRRKRKLVDLKVQLGLLFRSAVHWNLFLAIGFGMLVCWEYLLTGPQAGLSACAGAVWERFAPAFVVLAALLPAVIYDSYRFGHRLAGPIFRLRTELQNLAQGRPARKVKFRRGDYWHDLAADFNSILDERQEAGEGSTAETPRTAESGARVAG